MDDIVGMYGADDDDNDDDNKTPSNQQKISLISKAAHTEIVVDGHTVKIIDPDYVNMLEQRLRNTERMMANMQNTIARLEDNYRNRIRDIEKLRTTLNNKIDKAS